MFVFTLKSHSLFFLAKSGFRTKSMLTVPLIDSSSDTVTCFEQQSFRARVHSFLEKTCHFLSASCCTCFFPALLWYRPCSWAQLLFKFI